MSYTNATYDILDIIFVVSIDIDDDGRFDFEAEKWNKWKKRMGRREEGREGSCLLCLHCEAKFGIETAAIVKHTYPSTRVRGNTLEKLKGKLLEVSLQFLTLRLPSASDFEKRENVRLRLRLTVTFWPSKP